MRKVLFFSLVVFLPSLAHAFPYEIQQGDTVSGIAEKHGITVKVLIGANKGLTTETTLAVGRILEIPKIKFEEFQATREALAGVTQQLAEAQRERSRFEVLTKENGEIIQRLEGEKFALQQERDTAQELARSSRSYFWILSVLLCVSAVLVVTLSFLALLFRRADKSKVEAVTNAQKAEEEAKAEIVRLKEHHQRELVRVQGAVRAQLETATREGQVSSPPVRSLPKRR